MVSLSGKFLILDDVNPKFYFSYDHLIFYFRSCISGIFCVEFYVNIIILVFVALIVVFQSINCGSKNFKYFCSLLTAVYLFHLLRIQVAKWVVMDFGFCDISLMNIVKVEGKSTTTNRISIVQNVYFNFLHIVSTDIPYDFVSIVIPI